MSGHLMRLTQVRLVIQIYDRTDLTHQLKDQKQVQYTKVAISNPKTLSRISFLI